MSTVELAPRRAPFVATASLVAVSLVPLVLAQVWFIPALTARVIDTFPEVAFLRLPAIVWGAIAIGCWEAVALIGIRLILLAADGRSDSPRYRWMKRMTACLLAYVALVVAAFIAVSALGFMTAGLMLGLVVTGTLTAVAAGALSLFIASRR